MFDMLNISVGHPDPEPDTHVLGPPGFDMICKKFFCILKVTEESDQELDPDPEPDPDPDPLVRGTDPRIRIPKLSRIPNTLKTIQ